MSATTQVSFVVTAATTITNSDYRVNASGGYNAIGNIPVVTSISAPGTPALAISKTGPLTATAGGLVTYTLTITNSGTAGPTNLVITDAIPTGANYVIGGTKIGGVIRWIVPTLPLSATTQVSFVVTATTTITNSDYRVSASGGYNATGNVPVVTIINTNAPSMQRIYLPVIFKE
jgi:uncharacterized repeat protein (TIGR01451 family)